jgi:hypothetical protein
MFCNFAATLLLFFFEHDQVLFPVVPNSHPASRRRSAFLARSRSPADAPIVQKAPPPRIALTYPTPLPRLPVRVLLSQASASVPARHVPLPDGRLSPQLASTWMNRRPPVASLPLLHLVFTDFSPLAHATSAPRMPAEPPPSLAPCLRCFAASFD